jgi:hypothetical protein
MTEEFKITEPRADSSAVVAMIQTVITEARQQALALQMVQRDVQDQAKDLAVIMKILRGDNGKDSMIIRMNVMERSLGETGNVLSELKSLLQARQLEETRQKWQLLVTIIAGLMALVSPILATLLALRKP